MARSERIVFEIGEKIDELQKGISGQPWRNASRIVFATALEKSVSGLEELRQLFAEAVEEMNKDPKEGKPELKPFLKELEKLLEVLEKNQQFERQKKAKGSVVNELEKEETPELYADLEQRILGLLLKARYSLERMTIFMRRQGLRPLTEKSSASQVMRVLERKEDELQELREKYEDVRKKSYLGYLEEESIADQEQELGELSRSMALGAEELEKTISFHKSQVEYIENSYAELKQKVSSLEENFLAYTEKSEELIKNLKKERDYAKKIVLDVEHETLQLRNTYTRELLSLEETKLAAKKEAEKKFETENRRLRNELSEQADLLKHFRKIAEDRLKKEHELEEKVKKLALVAKTHEKHEAVKKALSRKSGTRRKKKKRKK
jgi:hypothetical protein